MLTERKRYPDTPSRTFLHIRKREREKNSAARSLLLVLLSDSRHGLTSSPLPLFDVEEGKAVSANASMTSGGRSNGE